jgi:hypothetical protein
MSLRPRDTGSSPPSSTDGRQAAAIIAAFSLVTLALVGFVRLKSVQVEVGYRVHDLRTRLVVLDQQRASLEVERAALARPHRLAQLARDTLGLVPPDITTTTSLSSTVAPSRTTTTTAHAGHGSTP